MASSKRPRDTSWVPGRRQLATEADPTPVLSGPAVVLGGTPVISSESVGPTFPSRARIEAAIREIDDGLSGSPGSDIGPVPLRARLVAHWQCGEFQLLDHYEQTLGSVVCLRTLLELGLAHLASLGSKTEAPNAD